MSGEIAGIMDTVMKTWQAAVPGFFRFSKAPAGSSGDIHVQFGDSSLNPHFGAVTDNWDGAGSFPGNVALSSVRSWTRRVLHDVLLHEVGHGLGLAHSDAAASTMNHTVPTLSGLNPLDAETLRAIKLLYGWREPVQLPDRASSDGPALATTWFANFTSSTYTLHMAWKGVTGDEGLWYASSSDGITWSPQESIGFARSAHGPALCAYDRENLAMLYRGPGDDQALHFAINPGGAGWRGAAAPVGWSAHRPALIAFGPTAASLIAAWRGMDADQSLWWSRFDGTGPGHRSSSSRAWRARTDRRSCRMVTSCGWSGRAPATTATSGPPRSMAPRGRRSRRSDTRTWMAAVFLPPISRSARAKAPPSRPGTGS
ncbi:MAG: matrixin family metalloprotease [Rhodospirillales bacterium]|nr:matrixin family metalloprotease [Rhodospirillales bacterium]